jgi:hypothetical protein
METRSGLAVRIKHRTGWFVPLAAAILVAGAALLAPGFV